MKKISLVSLGCPKNLVDSEEMLTLLSLSGWELTDDIASAHTIIVNTCGFIQSAKEESINSVLEMAKFKTNGNCKYLIIAGCLGQRYGEELLHEIPEADGIVGTDAFCDLPRILQLIESGKHGVYLQPARANHPIERIITTPGHYAYLKIAEGCDNCCSYCIIPRIRGPYRSRPYTDIMEEAKYLVSRGVRELIIVAQDTTRYGEDLYGKLRLAELLNDLNAISDLKWIRVMYMYPDNFTEELINAFAQLPKVCKYVDLPLQHASDRLLRSMNRNDKQKDVASLLKKVRDRIPGVAVRTTFIVGFPGETEEDFNELKSFVKKQKFENAGVFRYSQEENTVAGAMPDQIPEMIKEERYNELMSIQAKVSENIHRSHEGEIIEVVVEGYDEQEPDLAYGRSYREAPDIDGTVFIENAKNLTVGTIVKIKIEQGFTYEYVGSLYNEVKENNA